jgi:hypothetical protein
MYLDIIQHAGQTNAPLFFFFAGVLVICLCYKEKTALHRSVHHRMMNQLHRENNNHYLKSMGAIIF